MNEADVVRVDEQPTPLVRAEGKEIAVETEVVERCEMSWPAGDHAGTDGKTDAVLVRLKPDTTYAGLRVLVRLKPDTTYARLRVLVR
jgi:hypothetical protein